MEESNSQGLEEVIARRLIKQMEPADGRGKLSTNSDTEVGGGGETGKEKSASISRNEPAQSSSIDVVTGDAEIVAQPVIDLTTSQAPECRFQ